MVTRRSRDTILVRQWGGLGNQLFRFAAGLRLSQHWGCDIINLVHPDEFSRGSKHVRRFELPEMLSDVAWRRAGRIDRLLQSERGITQVVQIPSRFLGLSTTLRETDEYHFDETMLEQPRTLKVYFIGYWQVAKYVEEVGPSVRAMYDPLAGLSNQDLVVLDRIRSSPTPVSIHVRRGDYLKAGSNIRVLPDDYYDSALQRMRSQLDELTPVIFSDDQEHARRLFGHVSNAIFVNHNSEMKAAGDMKLMSLCHHHVIANSSMSWWGAWLNSRPDKIVVAPSFWFGSESTCYPDLIPQGWLRTGSHF